MSTKVIELRCWNKDQTIKVGHREVRALRPGPHRMDGEVPGLVMSFNEHTGITSCDAPGFSTAVPASVAQPIFAEAAIPLGVPVDVVVAPPAAATPSVVRDTSDDPDDGSEEPTYADDDEIDDEEIKGLLQSPDAKKAVEERSKPKATKKKAKIA